MGDAVERVGSEESPRTGRAQSTERHADIDGKPSNPGTLTAPASASSDQPTRRWYVRCSDCLAVGAVDVPEVGLAVREPARGVCVCGGRIEVMGMVSRGRLVRQRTESACDASCTGARGPVCECVCGARNHGRGVVVTITTDAGSVPRYQLAADLGRAEEFRAALAAARARLEAFASDVVARKLGGEFLSAADFARFREIRRQDEALQKARRGRTHKGRLAALAAVAR